ncbi:Replication protein A 14 kDa subunit [Trichoplax sp. H2]|nr:Replication protein A 14 kDa subunit [Trichoplax sp. H2]|eukprot:RDD42795.1 Replication protein A 14 kDa subunit [Trichoplax sp. H2]
MEARQRVNGAMMNANIGKEVCIIGKIEQVIEGTSIRLSCSDGKLVTVSFIEPLKENTGIVEIVGKVESNGNVTGHSIVYLNGKTQFDLAVYNEAISVAVKYPDLF